MLTADTITNATIRSLRHGAAMALARAPDDESLARAQRIVAACDVAIDGHPAVRPLARWICAQTINLANAGSEVSDERA